MEESLVVCEVIASPVVIARQFQSQNLLDDMFHNIVEESLVICEVIASPVVIARQFQS